MKEYNPAYGGGAGTGAGGAITEADVAVALEHKLFTGHLSITHTDGSLTYDNGIMMHNLAKPSNDGMGVTYGTGMGDAFMALGEDANFFVGYQVGARSPHVMGLEDVDSPEFTSLTVLGINLDIAQIMFGAGIKAATGYGGIGGRVVFYLAGTTDVLATTCDNNIWASGIQSDGHGYGGIHDTVADAFNTGDLALVWPVSTATSLDIKFEFKAPVKLKGTGTWGTTWMPTMEFDHTDTTLAQVVYYDIWTAKTFAVNDKVVVDGVIYRANTAGAQVGSFAANSALWTEVGNVPSVLLWKGGISVTDFNLLASGVEGGMYRISEAGTLTGGQAAIIGDQVILNKDISVTVTAADFDFFENIEPGTVIPPWSAKTYVLDEAIYEQGELYYCSTAGAQITSFAANVADWSHFSRIDSHLKFDTDGAYNVGSASKSAKRVYLTDGIYHDSSKVMDLSATDTDIYSPDGLTAIGVRNSNIYFMNAGGAVLPWASADLLDLGTDGARFNKLYLKDSMYGPATFGIKSGTTNRFDYNATRSLLSSPNGLSYSSVANGSYKFFDATRDRIAVSGTATVLDSPDGLNESIVDNTKVSMNVGAVDRVLADATGTAVVSPDTLSQVAVTNTGTTVTGFTKLGAGAPEIQMKHVAVVTANAVGGITSVAHGVTRTKIIGVQVVVTGTPNTMGPGYTTALTYKYDWYMDATKVYIILGGAATQMISQVADILITYES
jgi:hypothetical protein